MPARTQTIVIEQGATFSLPLFVGQEFNGLPCRAPLRRTFRGETYATFAATDVANGISTISLTADQTAALNAPNSSAGLDREVPFGVWNHEVVSGSTVYRTHQGKAILAREVTT